MEATINNNQAAVPPRGGSAGEPRPICYPPAPLNGGPLTAATPEKVGEWVWQPKVDDWRGVLHVQSMTLWNQYGELSSISHKFAEALEYLREHCWNGWLDVGLMENRHDLMRGCIIVFDWIEPTLRLSARRNFLRASRLVELPVDVAGLLAATGGQLRDAVFLINQWENVESTADAVKRQDWLQSQNKGIGHKFYEGLVAKRIDSLYPFHQRPKVETADWIKHRFDQ